MWILFGYPFVLALCPRREWRTDSEFRPHVTVIVPAFNEREALADKLRALEEIHYERDKLEIVVVVDEDEESARLARLASPRSKVIFSANRRGKFRAVYEAIGSSSSDIVLITDANNTLDRDAILAAVRHFADESIWGVTGQRFETGSAYERYEGFLRSLESRSGSVAAASGEVFFLRRKRIPGAPDEPPLMDDFWLLCRLVESGGRVVYEPRARSSEPAIAVAAELERRSRLVAGLAEAVHELRGTPAPYSVRLVSHKFGRLLLPWFLVVSVLSSAVLARRRPYREGLLAQLAFYSLGALSAAGVSLPGRYSIVSNGAQQFLIGNLATFRGLARGVRRRQSVIWSPVR